MSLENVKNKNQGTEINNLIKPFSHGISLQKIADLVFLFNTCTLIGNHRGYGFDSVICRFSFVLLLAVELIYIYKMASNKLYINRIFKQYILFWVYFFVSILWGNFADGVSHIKEIVQILVIVSFVVQNVNTREQAEKYLKYVLWAAIYTDIRLVIYTPISVWGSERVGEALNINANSVGIYSAIGLIICFYFTTKNITYRYMVFFLGAISLFSGSRKAFFIIAIGIFLYVIGKENGLKAILNIVVGIILLLVLFMLVMYVPQFYNVLGYRIDKVIYTLTGTTIARTSRVFDHSSVERTFYRNFAMSMFYEHPILGYGANGFVTKMRQIAYSHVSYSHCNYTELLATLGCVGFGLYYSMHIITLIRLFIRRHKDGTYKDRLILCCIVLMVALLFAEYYLVAYIEVYIQIVMCLCAIIADNALHDNREELKYE